MKRQGLEDEDLSDKMRLDKLLALLGEGTRSEIKAMVRAGRVTVDGRAAKDAGMQVCGEMDDIRLDGPGAVLQGRPPRDAQQALPAC